MAAPVPEVLEHIAPWTEAEFLDVPVDRRVELQLYAPAGVPHYLRIELDEAGPGALVHRWELSRYAEVASVDFGRPLILTEPIAVTLDVAALAASTRPT